MNEPTQDADAKLNEDFQEFLRSEPYQLALYKESVNRDLVWLKVPQSVCGIDLRPLTSRDLLALFCLRSPLIAASFLDGTKKPLTDWPTEAPADFSESFIHIRHSEVARFFWIQSVGFTGIQGGCLNRWMAARKLNAFVRRVRSVKYGEACEEIRNYLNAALVDAPAGSSNAKTGPSVASWVSSDIHLIAKEYGWSADYILDLPLAQLFQCERRIISQDGKKSALGNRTDSMRAKWLRERREQMAKN